MHLLFAPSKENLLQLLSPKLYVPVVARLEYRPVFLPLYLAQMLTFQPIRASFWPRMQVQPSLPEVPARLSPHYNI